MVDDSLIHSLPLSSLPYKTRKLLSCLLNSQKIIPSDGPDKLPRDWRGLAYRVKILAEMESDIRLYIDKTEKVLNIWQGSNPNATVGELLGHLEFIDRYDVRDDLINNLREVINSGEPLGSKHNQIALQNNLNGASTEGDSEQITYLDRPGYAHIFDAIVLYADEDKDFVDDMLQRMSEEGFQICTIDDLHVGHTTQYAPVAHLIADRCLRIILVFSPEFLNSTGMTFYMDYAQAVSIESNQRKIIPIVYRACNLPRHLSYYHKLFYQSKERPMYNFWHKLKQSLEAARWANAQQQHLQNRLEASTPASGPPQIIVEEFPSAKLADLDDDIFLPRPDRSISMTALDTLKAIPYTDTGSLSNVSQVSGSSLLTKKKKKKSPFRKLFSSFKGKKKDAILIAD